MNARLEALARERAHLLERSALQRLRLGREAHALRAAVSWRSAPKALATQPVLRTAAWSLALSLVGVNRAARALMLAGRVILVVKLARAAIGYARAPARTN